jgi:mRNA interferase HigB
MLKYADDVNGFVAINLRQNMYRIITVIHYAKTTEEDQIEGHVYLRSFLTHRLLDNPRNRDRRFDTK